MKREEFIEALIEELMSDRIQVTCLDNKILDTELLTLETGESLTSDPLPVIVDSRLVEKTMREWICCILSGVNVNLEEQKYFGFAIDGKHFSNSEKTDIMLLELLTAIVKVKISGYNWYETVWFFVSEDEWDSSPGETYTFFLVHEPSKKIIVEDFVFSRNALKQKPIWHYFQKPYSEKRDIKYEAYIRFMYERYFCETDSGKINVIAYALKKKNKD